MSTLRGLTDALRFIPPGTPRATELQAELLSGPTGVVPAPVIQSPWTVGDHLGTVVWSDLFGVQDWLPLTRAEAMAVPAVARARNIVCTTLGRLPLLVERDGAEVAPVPMVIRQPDPAQPRYVQLVWTIDDLIFSGVSWGLILSRLATGHPQHLRRIHPGGVEQEGNRFKVYGEYVDPANLVRIDGPHEGILNYASRTLRVARSLENSAKRFADNPVPAVELHQTDDVEMSEPKINALIASWVAARRGENGGVAYTSRNIDAKIHGQPAEHLLTHGRNAAAVDAARVVGVPADAVDAAPEESSMTYANVESRNRTLIDYGMAAYAAAVEARLSMDDILPAGSTVRWDYSTITEPSATQPTQEPAE